MSAIKERDNCSNYHHGNLRNTLISAAAQLIEENGSADFAMIEAARRAGVSSAAPYRHFRDKEALLEAVTEVAFMALAESTRAVSDRASPGTEECLIALGKAYLRFVTEHPQFYDLMWGDRGLRATNLKDTDLKSSGFYILVEAVRAWCERSKLRNFNELELAVKLWAIAHGLACLAMNRYAEKFMPEKDIYTLLESSTLTFLDGLRRET